MPLHRHSPGSAPGHSLIEVLVVLAILGALSLAGVTVLGNRRATYYQQGWTWSASSGR